VEGLSKVVIPSAARSLESADVGALLLEGRMLFKGLRFFVAALLRMTVVEGVYHHGERAVAPLGGQQ